MNAEQLNNEIKRQCPFNKCVWYAKKQEPNWSIEKIEDYVQDIFLWLITKGKEMFEKSLEINYGFNCFMRAFKQYSFWMKDPTNLKNKYPTVLYEEFTTTKDNLTVNPILDKQYAEDTKGNSLAPYEKKVVYTDHQIMHKMKNAQGIVSIQQYDIINLDDYLVDAISFFYNKDLMRKYLLSSDCEFRDYFSKLPDYFMNVVEDILSLNSCCAYNTAQVYYNATGREIPYHERSMQNTWGNVYKSLHQNRTMYPDEKRWAMWNRDPIEPKTYRHADGTTYKFKQQTEEERLVWDEWEK